MGRIRFSPPRVRTIIASTIVAAAFLFFFLRLFLPSLTAMTYGFPSYYSGAHLVIQGRWSSRVYDYTWFRDEVLKLTDGRIGETLRMNPPTTSLLMLPIAGLDIATARILWQWFNLAALGLALGLILHSTNMREPLLTALFLFGTFLYAPLWENIREGQAYILLLALYALVWYGTVQRKLFTSAIGLGLAGAIKLSGAPLWLILAVKGQWRTLAIALLTVAVCALASLSFAGIDGWRVFLLGLPARAAALDSVANLAFQTTPSFFQHLFVFQADWNPQPLLNAPPLAIALTLLTALVALGLTCWYARDADWDLAFAAGVTLSVILFPLAEEYHYTLLLLPLYVVSARIYPAHRAVDILVLALILVLLAFPWDYKALTLNDGWLALLAYPRLYGGWLLWLWLFKQMYRPSVARVASPLGATP